MRKEHFTIGSTRKRLNVTLIQLQYCQLTHNYVSEFPVTLFPNTVMIFMIAI